MLIRPAKVQLVICAADGRVLLTAVLDKLVMLEIVLEALFAIVAAIILCATENAVPLEITEDICVSSARLMCQEQILKD